MKDDRTLQEKIEETVEYLMRTKGFSDPKELIEIVSETYGNELDEFVPDSRCRNTVASWEEVVRETESEIYCASRQDALDRFRD